MKSASPLTAADSARLSELYSRYQAGPLPIAEAMELRDLSARSLEAMLEDFVAKHPHRFKGTPA